MPRYQVTAPDGRTVILEGAAPPTDADLEEVFKGLPAAKQAQEEAPFDRAAAFARDRAEEGRLINQMPRLAGGAISGAGGPVGAAASGAGEKISQFMEGKDDPRALAQATAIGAVPFGRLAELGKVAGKVAVPAAAGGANYLVNKAADMAYGKDDATPSAERQAAVVASITAAMPLLGRVLGAITRNVSKEEAVRVAEMIANNPNKDAVLASMKAKGAAAVPSSVNPSFKNKFLEAVGGIQGTERAIAEANQPLFNAMGRREAGLAPLEPINDSTLAAARNRIAGDSYKPIRDAGLGDLLDNWRGASTKLKEAEAKIAGGKFTPERGAAVDAAEKELADASQRLDIAAKTAGLTGDIEAAKVAFAKNYDVKSAILPGTDEVRPELLGAGRADIGPLSGELEEMVKFQNAFGRSSKNPLKMASAPGVAGQGAAFVAGGGDPAKTAAMSGGIPLVREYAQKLLASPGYQAKNAVRNYSPKTSADPKVNAALAKTAAIAAAKKAKDKDKNK